MSSQLDCAALAERLRGRGVVEEGCWLWRGMVGPDGTGRISLAVGKGRKLFRVHRLALHVWAGLPLRSKAVAVNVCGRRHCFNPDHWRLVQGALLRPGEANGRARLTEKEVKAMLEAYHKEACSPQELARRFGGKVKSRTVEAILKGRSWRHLERPVYKGRQS